MTFLRVEGGGNLDRVVIDGDHARIETLHAGVALPTSMALAGRDAWVAEGQLDHVFDAAKKCLPPRLPFDLYAVPMPMD